MNESVCVRRWMMRRMLKHRLKELVMLKAMKSRSTKLKEMMMMMKLLNVYCVALVKVYCVFVGDDNKNAEKLD